MAHVHVANAHSEDAQVFISKTLLWSIVDIVYDVGSFAVGLGELKTATSAAALPQTIENARDLYNVLKYSAKLLATTGSIASNSANAAKNFIEIFSRKSIKIARGNFRDCQSTTGLDWMTPSALAGIPGLKTLNMTVLTDDGRKVANFDTNHDHSWIVTDPSVVRSKYGTIWQTDAGSGSFPWEGSNQSKKPAAEHGGFLWRVQNGTPWQIAFWPNVFMMQQTTGMGGTFGKANEAPRLEPGHTNGWGECWNFGPYNFSTAVPLRINVDVNNRNSPSFGSPLGKYADFSIPKELIYGSEMTVIIRQEPKSNSDSLVASDLVIKHPSLGTKTIPAGGRV
ncbi:MAG TPA: hypothetical protein VF713_18050 [Thermoanaerobaculia bacterium]